MVIITPCTNWLIIMALKKSTLKMYSTLYMYEIAFPCLQVQYMVYLRCISKPQMKGWWWGFDKFMCTRQCSWKFVVALFGPGLPTPLRCVESHAFLSKIHTLLQALCYLVPQLFSKRYLSFLLLCNWCLLTFAVLLFWQGSSMTYLMFLLCC